MEVHPPERGIQSWQDFFVHKTTTVESKLRTTEVIQDSLDAESDLGSCESQEKMPLKRTLLWAQLFKLSNRT